MQLQLALKQQLLETGTSQPWKGTTLPSYASQFTCKGVRWYPCPRAFVHEEHGRGRWREDISAEEQQRGSRQQGGKSTGSGNVARENGSCQQLVAFAEVEDCEQLI